MDGKQSIHRRWCMGKRIRKSIPGFWFGFSGSFADEVSSIGGVWGSVSSMSVGGDWGSIGTIGGGIWVSSISVVRIGQPWLSFSIGVSRSLANEVSSSIGGDWGSIGSMSVGSDWGSIGTIGGIWVSSISVSSSIGQPWLGIS